MGGCEEEQVPAGMPWWCRGLGVAPVAAAGLALFGSGGRDPLTVLIWAAVTYWVTGALSRRVLVRRGHSQEVARGWVEAGLQASWVLWLMGAFAVWVTVDAVRTAAGPAGDWWDWVVVAVLGVMWLFWVSVGVGALADWRRRRASS